VLGFAEAPAAAAAATGRRPRPGAVPGDDALADLYEAPLPLPDGDILAVGDRTTTAMAAARRPTSPQPTECGHPPHVRTTDGRCGACVGQRWARLRPKRRRAAADEPTDVMKGRAAPLTRSPRSRAPEACNGDTADARQQQPSAAGGRRHGTAEHHDRTGEPDRRRPRGALALPGLPHPDGPNAPTRRRRSVPALPGNGRLHAPPQAYVCRSGGAADVGDDVCVHVSRCAAGRARLRNSTPPLPNCDPTMTEGRGLRVSDRGTKIDSRR
jgi:hypothetical protein